MKSRNKQLQIYENNWAALEIMKTIIKNKWSYRSKIGCLETNNCGNQELPKQRQNSRSQQASAGGACSASDGGDGDDEASNRGGDLVTVMREIRKTVV